MAEPIIREASDGDLDVMLSLWRTLENAQGAHRIFLTRPNPEKRIAQLLLEAIESPDARVFVAEGPEGLLGMAVARLEEQAYESMSEATVVELSRVVVSADARGLGIGRALIDAATEFGKGRGASYVTAKTFTGNVQGRAFWDRLGFVSRYEQRVRPIGPSHSADILDGEEAD